MTRHGLTFGIYPGSAAGDVAGAPDRPGRINQALDQLQGPAGRSFAVRAYDLYVDPGDTAETGFLETPAGYDRYLGRGRTLDLVVPYHSRSGDVPGYCAFIEGLIDRHGDRIVTLQVAEEPNVTDNPVLDGAYPGITDALIEGVHAAKERARLRGHRHLKVGCNSSPLIGPSVSFFSDLVRVGGEQFIRDLDYIGLDFFPDVFRPIPADRLAPFVQSLLEAHRRDSLGPAGLGHLPIIITEHGWPTSPGRTQERQAEVLSTVVEVVSRNAEALNLTGYIHHTLRDARSDDPGLMCHFGLMTDDYTPKPAFHTYRNLIDALSQPNPGPGLARRF
jgi:hypothetical protein